ncbi:MAG: TetR/AcrR family transcriptional regulator [candidate division KSB1 bacterium]|nr:TetR/AcrR family transcriptional regulator [candidate division KSB1 bacterium]MDZ7365612.1 TetR/AcrR family transcriptional regulator [candidate division KSB1 bacterium]MDZ7403312.1 TetR/AcrR family transcriptional regulator [candidate division KSB1 bacterium]
MNEEDREIRERILLKVKEKFAAVGYGKTSMDDVAGELGMSKKTLYKFFPTKLKLAEMLVEHVLAEVNRRCDAILASPLPAVEKLLRIVQMITEQQQRFVTKTLLESLRSQLPHLWRRIEAFRRERMRKNLEVILEQGKRDGTVRADFNREMFFHFLIGAIDEGINPGVLIHSSCSMHDALSALIDIFMNGALTPKGRGQYQKLRAANLSLK